MKKYICSYWLIAAIIIAVSTMQNADAKYASIVIDANSHQVLHAVNAYTKNYPASLTKMMTLYLLFEAIENKKINLNSRIKFSKRAAGQAPSKLGVKAGENINVKTAIKALAVKSANDVATAVAEKLAKSEHRFAKIMTRKARELGMNSTQFKNASGLPNKRQFSTAKDMATLVQALQRHFPQYYRYFSLKKFTFRGKTIKSHNKLLKSYTGANGVKTGYTRASGFNLATSVERNGKRIIGVVFGGKTSRSRNKHMKKLLDKGFKIQSYTAFAKAPINKKLAEALNINTKVTTKTIPLPVTNVSQAIKQSINDNKITTKTTTKTTAKTETKTATKTSNNTIKTAQAKTKIQKQYTQNALAHIPPDLPTPYYNGGLAQTIIAKSPQKISLIQNFKTGNPHYNGGGWAVQIGVFKNIIQAKKQLEKIIPIKKYKSENIIISQANRKGPYYKARLVAMKKNNAYKLCKLLKNKKIDCFVLSPNAT